jgi:hypothetical protein
MDLYPFDSHDKGDKDMYSEGGWGFANPSEILIDGRLIRDGDHLAVELSGWMQERGGDSTTFTRTRRVAIGDASIKNGTAQDVATCLASYGAHRPFTPITGQTFHDSHVGNAWFWLDSPNGEHLSMRAKCRTDTDGDDDGDVGCDPVQFDPLTVLIK